MRVGGLAKGSLIITALAGLALGLTMFSGSDASAGTPDITIDVGDAWFCSEKFDPGVCITEIETGQTVVWDFTGAAAPHSTTECGASCDSPTEDPLWDSGVINTMSPDRTFDFTFTQPGSYNYYCFVHPFQQGQIIVTGEPLTVGDSNCNGIVNAIDATIILQYDAGLLGSLSCEENADANQNGTVNAIDATLILQYDAGLIDQLPP